MSKVKFKRTVLSTAPLLIERGYQIQDPSPASDVIRLWKTPSPGVRCEVDIELMPMFVTPTRAFTVMLYRLRLQDFPKEESRYLPLTIDLPNLLWFLYHVNAIPRRNYWEFTDEQSLAEQLAKAQSLLIDYGLPWLEDPISDTEWVRNPKNPTTT